MKENGTKECKYISYTGSNREYEGVHVLRNPKCVNVRNFL